MLKSTWIIIFILFILLFDQIMKIWIKTHFFLYEDMSITNWFHIVFVENKGMGMGMDIINKKVLSIIRILVSFTIIVYLYQLLKKNISFGYVCCVSMVLAGSIGNAIDGIFYGVIFTKSLSNSIAIFSFFFDQPELWLNGKVVDMFYLSLFEWTCPKQIPFIGGFQFSFFSYVFNVADISITIGVILLVIFYRNTFLKSMKENLINLSH